MRAQQLRFLPDHGPSSVPEFSISILCVASLRNAAYVASTKQQ
jgi:hypothetical protein